ncbi:hypothetical protein OSB04_027178 [Centaurea solstitialis]|uniref:RING-type E3 ubiquitin transferase BRCA1 n=1 Tax=Centaurea solstitialis TaxID=347529 RepID=A0AA38SWV3_9ASTR|nr:hypothetical protein OSB04_027178 [Centaurea solstitialis]
MNSVVATVSGYHGSERFNLIKLISQSGASYVGAMNHSTTHLVCRKFEGKKYELARKFKTIVVNHRWIEECVKQGRRVSERPYMKQCGFEVGPLSLEIPVVAEEVRSVFGEVSTTCNFSKKPVIDVECDSGDDDDWTESWLLKENLLSDVRRNKDRRLKRKDTKRHSRQDVSLTNGYCLDESPSFALGRVETKDLSCPSSSTRVNKKRSNTIPESSQGRRKLTHKNIHNEVNSSSDSEEDFQHTEIYHNFVDISEPSTYSGRHESRRPYKTRLHDPAKRNTLILEDLENDEDLGTSNLNNAACTNGISTSLGRNSLDNSEEGDNDTDEKEYNPTASTALHLSCVICWTDFSSTRGVLPCGHRFCFSCIQNWADHMASMKKVSTCPLCKASFYSIQKMEDAVSSDQKIYSQTIPNDTSAMDVYILPHGEASAFHPLPVATPVCYQCSCREPEELLISCHSCELRCVHSYCLDPPQIPWVCVQCKDLRMRYVR